jgi:hypothetical protein
MSSSLSNNFLGARTPRSAGRILCGLPLVTLSTSFTLSFSQFVLLALATERCHPQHTSTDVLAVVMDI